MARSPRRRHRRRARGRRATTRARRARRVRRGAPARETLERHGVGVRCAVAALAGRRDRVGGRVRIGAGRRVHRHEALVVTPLRARGMGTARARLPST